MRENHKFLKDFLEFLKLYIYIKYYNYVGWAGQLTGLDSAQKGYADLGPTILFITFPLPSSCLQNDVCSRCRRR
jgi:hypothetical protein